MKTNLSSVLRIAPIRFAGGLTLGLFLILSAGCAKTGDPHPPVLLVPKPPADLSARQYGDQALVSVSMPAENTDGSPVTTLARVEVLRLTELGRQAAGQLSENEFLKRAELLFAIPAGKLPSYSHDKMLVFRDPLDFRDHSVIYSLAFRYALRFVNDKDQAAGLTNQVVLAPIPIPPAPKGLSDEVTQDYIRIRWDPPSANMDGSTPPRTMGYNVFRTEDPGHFPPNPINREPLAAAELTDRDFQFDRTYYYQVTVMGSRENPYAESPPSAPLQVMPRDIFAPGAPQNLNAVVDGSVVVLLWGPAAGNDVAGYRVYRKEQGAAESILLQQPLVTVLSYRDTAVQPGKTYVYRVTSLDTHGNESPPAEATVEIPKNGQARLMKPRIADYGFKKRKQAASEIRNQQSDFGWSIASSEKTKPLRLHDR